MSILLKTLHGKLLCLEISECLSSGCNLKQLASSEEGLSCDAIYLIHNGRIVTDYTCIQLTPGTIYNVAPRLYGGKGGFGSMLRAIGAQIEKTTNREACRDLSGRRMRDVNDEKKVTEWVAKQADREREEAKTKAERLKKRRSEPKHIFDDTNYMEKIRENAERIGDALQQGMKAASSLSTSNNGKRKLEEPSTSTGKKSCMWMDIDDEDFGDDDRETCLEANPNASSATSITGKSTQSKPSPLELQSQIASSNQPDSSLDQSSDNHSSRYSLDECSESQNGVSQINMVNTTSSLHSTDNTTVADGKSKLIEDVTGQNENQNTVSSSSTEVEPVNLDDFNSAKDLESVGLERLKRSLMSLGLKCGGTLEQRAERLFSTKGLSRDQIDPQLFSKNGKTKNSGKKKHF